MTPVELYDFVEKDEEVFGVEVDGNHIIVGNTTNAMLTSVHADELEDVCWKDLRGIIVGDRDVNALNHMTRVVGYFSRVSNWNKSKVGELKDRINGNYNIDGIKPSDDLVAERIIAAESI